MSSIDVLVPSYQYGRFLRAAVASIQNQGIENLRILIIDNASTDDSVAIARQLATEDSRIAVIARQRNLGYHASFNEAIDWAKAEYFAIVCADDLLSPGSLRRAISFMEQHPEAVFTIGKEVQFREGERPPASIAPEESQWRLFCGPQFVADRCRKLFAGPIVVRTAVQKQAGHYREDLLFTCDIEMLLRLATFGSVGETTAPQGYRRLHDANMGRIYHQDRASDLREFEAAYASFFHREGRSLGEELHLDRVARRYLAENAYWWGLRDLTKGRWRTGLHLLRFAVERAPRTILLPPVGTLCEKSPSLSKLMHAARKLAPRRRAKTAAGDGNEADDHRESPGKFALVNGSSPDMLEQIRLAGGGR